MRRRAPAHTVIRSRRCPQSVARVRRSVADQFPRRGRWAVIVSRPPALAEVRLRRPPQWREVPGNSPTRRRPTALPVHLLLGRCFSPTSAPGKCLYSAYSWAGCSASEVFSVLLLYGLEVRPLTVSDLRSLDFVINRFFMKLFCTNVMDTVKICQDYFNFELPSGIIEKRRKTFVACCVPRTS